MKKVFFTGIGVIAAVLLLTTPDASRAAAPLPILGVAGAKSAATKTAVAGKAAKTGVTTARYAKYTRNVKAGQKNRAMKEVTGWDGKTMRKNNRAGR